MLDCLQLAADAHYFPIMVSIFAVVLVLNAVLCFLVCRHDKTVWRPMLVFYLLQIVLFIFTLAAVQGSAVSLLGLLVSGVASELLLLLVGYRDKKQVK